MDTVIFIGYLAGVLTTIAFIPQVSRAWKLKETRDISPAMLVLFAAGVLLWTLYGVAVAAPPIIAANMVTFLLIIVLMGLKVKYR